MYTLDITVPLADIGPDTTPVEVTQFTDLGWVIAHQESCHSHTGNERLRTIMTSDVLSFPEYVEEV